MHAQPLNEPRLVAILVLEQFAMLALASTVEPLREANSVAGRELYQWKVVSATGESVRASNGLPIGVNGSINDVHACEMVIVVSSFDPQFYATRPILEWLRRLSRQGSAVGAVETGAYVLAKARLLDHYKATIHWENLDSFVEEFPKVRVTGNLFEIDRQRFSACGAAAAMDMMLHIIGSHVGARVASAVAEEFIYNRIRKADDPQRLDAAVRMGTGHPRMRRLLAALDRRTDESMTTGQMASLERISDRELRRLFRTYVGVSPQAYHRRLRVEKSRNMLRQTDLPIAEVALQCGFASASDFSRAFKREFRVSPGVERRRLGERGIGSLVSVPNPDARP